MLRSESWLLRRLRHRCVFAGSVGVGDRRWAEQPAVTNKPRPQSPGVAGIRASQCQGSRTLQEGLRREAERVLPEAGVQGLWAGTREAKVSRSNTRSNNSNISKSQNGMFLEENENCLNHLTNQTFFIKYPLLLPRHSRS